MKTQQWISKGNTTNVLDADKIFVDCPDKKVQLIYHDLDDCDNDRTKMILIGIFVFVAFISIISGAVLKSRKVPNKVVLFIKKTFGGSGYESVTNEEVCDENNYHYEVFILFADEDQDYVTSSIFEFCSGIVVTDR